MTKLYSTPIRHMIFTVECWLWKESFMAALSVMLKTPIQKKLPRKLSVSIDSLIVLSDYSRVSKDAASRQQTAITTKVWD